MRSKPGGLPRPFSEVPVYRLYGRKILRGIFNVTAIIAATGCQPPRQTEATPQSLRQPIAGTAVTRQLIIKFKPDTIACDAAGIAQLSLAARVPVEYVRAMSGGACVVKQSADDANGLGQGQETLRQHPAVDWLEQDTKMKAL